MDRESSPNQHNDKAVLMSAGILTGILGCLFCGPLVGCLLGASAAVGTARPTEAGNVARSIGRCGLRCVKCGTRRVQALDQQHQVSARVLLDATTTVYKKTAVLAAEHSAVLGARAAVDKTWQDIQTFDTRHGITERSWKATNDTLDTIHSWVMGEKPIDGENNNNNNNNNSFAATGFSIEDDIESDANREQDSQEVGDKDAHQGPTKRGGYAAVGGGEEEESILGTRLVF